MQCSYDMAAQSFFSVYIFAFTFTLILNYKVVNELTERLLLKIRQIGQTRGSDSTFQLEQQLEKCFNLHRVPRLKPIVLGCFLIEFEKII